MATPYNNVGHLVSGTPGTGTITLGSAIDNSFFTFAEAGVPNAGVVTYRIDFGFNVEIGRGTYTSSGTTLSRDVVLASKISGTAGTSKININAAGATVRIVEAADEMVTTDATRTLSAKTLTDPAITGAILEDIFTITDAAGFEIDPGNGTLQRVTLGANRTPAATNFQNGESVTLMVADGTAFTITWTTVGVVWVGGTAPTLATTGFTVIELWKEGNVIRGAHVGDVAS